MNNISKTFTGKRILKNKKIEKIQSETSITDSLSSSINDK